MDNFTDLGIMYISEQVSPENYEIRNVDPKQKGGTEWVEFDAILHTFFEMNRNTRQYLKNNVQECIEKDPKIQALLKDDAWYGEQDHPTAYYKNAPLTPERMKNVAMNNTSHKIRNPQFVDDYLKAHIITDAGCAAGINMYKKIIQGLIPGFSCRAMAKLVSMNGLPTVIIKKIICYDWVLYRSHARARSITDPVYKEKLTKYTTESTSDDILIELKELLVSTGKKNVSTRMIMEAFELEDDCIKGITKDRNQLILDAGTNTIYSNIDPKLKANLNGYLNSLSRR